MPIEQVEGGADAADGRAGDQPQAERRADQAHGARALLARRHVGHGRGHDGQVAAEGPADDPREQKEPEGAAEDPNGIAQRRAGDGDQQDAAPAPPVGERAPEGRENELQDRVEGRDQPAEEDGGEGVILAEGVGEVVALRQHPAQQPRLPVDLQVVFDQLRPEGEDDREPDQVDIEREKDDPERERALGRRSGGGGRGGHRIRPGRAAGNGSSARARAVSLRRSPRLRRGSRWRAAPHRCRRRSPPCPFPGGRAS